MILRPRRSALRTTSSATPCAEKIVTEPPGTSSSVSTNLTPRLERSLDHVRVVHDLVQHVDGRAVQLERAFDDLDRAVDTGAETARVGEAHFHVSVPR